MGLNIGGFDLGVDLPSISTAGIGTFITWLMIFLVIVIGGSVFMYLIYQMKIYNKKIIIFENLSGQGYLPTGKDYARLIKVGTSGEEILYLRKKRVYRTAYGRKMGKNTYWFAIGSDGYWYNFLLGDLDTKMGMLDIEPVDRDMRYMHVAIDKNIEKRYNKESFMQKYGQFILNSVFLIIMVIAIWLLMSKAGDLITQAKPVADGLKFAAEELKNAYSHLDAICSSSGYTGG